MFILNINYQKFNKYIFLCLFRVINVKLSLITNGYKAKITDGHN